MQNVSNQMCGDPWLKKGFATNFETRPRFRIIIFVHFWIDLSNVFFLQAETRPAAQNTFYESLKKTAAGAIFQCFDRRQQNKMIPSTWSPLKNRHCTFKQKHCFMFSIFHILFVFYIFEICLNMFL